MTHMRYALILLLALAGCARPPPRPAAESVRYLPVAYETLPGWGEARHSASLQAFLAGCPRPALAQACELAASIPAGDDAAARGYFESGFEAYALASPESGETGLITGYYEPVLFGSRVPDDFHRHPIHGVPDDLRRRAPYFTRREIEARGAAFPAPVIAWVADPVELFFLHVQGSGQLSFPDGERIRVGYADTNGHPYRSVGNYLIERGELALEQASMQGIKAWAAANPGKLQEALGYNARYVFFRELAAADGRGPIGALGVPLTAEYSVAVDRRFVPLGAPVYLATTFPLSSEPLERLMAAQDAGSAIRGVVRADFYWGTGVEAGAQAGRMRQPGRMWLLWPRGAALPDGG